MKQVDFDERRKIVELCVDFVFGNLIGAFICGFVACRGIVQMNKFMATHAKSSTTGVGFAKWPFALIFSIGFFLLAFSFLWSIVRQYAKKPSQTEEKEEQQ